MPTRITLRPKAKICGQRSSHWDDLLEWLDYAELTSQTDVKAVGPLPTLETCFYPAQCNIFVKDYTSVRRKRKTNCERPEKNVSSWRILHKCIFEILWPDRWKRQIAVQLSAERQNAVQLGKLEIIACLSFQIAASERVAKKIVTTSKTQTITHVLNNQPGTSSHFKKCVC